MLDEVKYSQCPVCTDLDTSKCEVKMGAVVWGYLQALMYKMGSQEFAAYLLGSISEDGQKFIVDDYYIPTQGVNSVNVEIGEEIFTIPKEIRERIIGHLHSHHIMGFSPSGTDKEHLNYPLHIIIAHQGYKTTIRKRVGCGKWLAISDVSITFYSDYVELGETEKIEIIQPKYVDQYQSRLDEDGNYFDPVEEKDNFEEYKKYLENENNSWFPPSSEVVSREIQDGMEI